MMPLSIRQSGRAVLVVAAVACLAVGFSAAKAADNPKEPAAFSEPVVVEALGFAEMPEGKTHEEAHREALLDARRNALIQAHVAVEADSQVKDMRVAEEVVRSRASGYVQEMEVWEAGVVPDSRPPVYRVRVRAAVWPLPRAASVALPGVAGDPWQPVVSLAVSSDAPDQPAAPLRAELADAFRRCGVAVIAPEDARPALSVSVRVATPAAAEEAWTKIAWEIRLTQGSGAEDPAQESAPPLIGQWLITKRVTPDSEWWQRVGVAMAQDATRLWGTPRPVTVRFTNVDEALARRLETAFGSAPGSRLERPEGSPDLVATVSLAGDPVQALQPVLEKSGDAVKLVQASMTQLTYAAAPAESPPAHANP